MFIFSIMFAKMLDDSDTCVGDMSCLEGERGLYAFGEILLY